MKSPCFPFWGRHFECTLAHIVYEPIFRECLILLEHFLAVYVNINYAVLAISATIFRSRSDHSNVFRVHLVRPNEARFILCGMRFVSEYWLFQFCVCPRAENCWVLLSITHFRAGYFYAGVFPLSKQFLMFSVRLVVVYLSIILPTHVFRSKKH